MKRHLLVMGLVAALFAALPVMSLAGTTHFNNMMSQDGALVLEVLSMEKGYGVTHLKCALKNVSDREFGRVNLMITTYEMGGHWNTSMADFEEIMPGQVRIFETYVPGHAPLINRIEADFTGISEAAY